MKSQGRAETTKIFKSSAACFVHYDFHLKLVTMTSYKLANRNKQLGGDSTISFLWNWIFKRSKSSNFAFFLVSPSATQCQKKGSVGTSYQKRQDLLQSRCWKFFLLRISYKWQHKRRLFASIEKRKENCCLFKKWKERFPPTQLFHPVFTQKSSVFVPKRCYEHWRICHAQHCTDWKSFSAPASIGFEKCFITFCDKQLMSSVERCDTSQSTGRAPRDFRKTPRPMLTSSCMRRFKAQDDMSEKN